MSYWNYRLIKDAQGNFGVYEIYYNDKGVPEYKAWDLAELWGETKEEVVSTLEMMLNDVKNRPTLDKDLRELK